MANWIGYQWLAKTYEIEAVQPFAISSCIGKARSTTTQEGLTVETYVEASRPEPTFSAHLGFALKREGVHLEFLARLFERTSPQVLSEWANREPSGQYARRAGFLFEWLTGQTIDFPGVCVGNYVLALPVEDYLTATQVTNVPRWRVRNNLPGTRAYCPLVRRTVGIRALENYDCAAKLRELEWKFGADILLRSAVWLTIKESRSSFLIEHEENQTDRIGRFAQVMEKRCGTGDNPLAPEFLAQIQAEILGARALRTGMRRSPVFIGESDLRGEVVHYVAPHFEQIEALLEGLRAFAALTRGASPLLRAAVISFGFVYIHPLSDGNGRLSRFLVNDILRRDGASPAPFILPISATITRTVTQRAAYDRALEQFSKPLMERFAGACSFGASDDIEACEDGILTNFRFAAYEEARWAWAFPDLTAQTHYLGELIQETVHTEMRREARFLLELRRTRERVKEVLEAPDVEIDRIIRSVRHNAGTISGKLASEFPILDDQKLAQAIIEAIMDAARKETAEKETLK